MSPFRPSSDGVLVALKVAPRASRERVDGVAIEADGRAVLALRVTAPPDGGRANEAVLRLLAKRWRVPRTSLRLVSGQTARRKQLHIAGDPEALLGALTKAEGQS
jgi:uncharacterized protein